MFKERGSCGTGTKHPFTYSSAAPYLPYVLGHIFGVDEDRKQAVDVPLKLMVALCRERPRTSEVSVSVKWEGKFSTWFVTDWFINDTHWEPKTSSLPNHPGSPHLGPTCCHHLSYEKPNGFPSHSGH